MTDREKLIELLEDCAFMEGYGSDLREKQADYLLENGVIIMPYRAGTIICEYVIDEVTYIQSYGFNGEIADRKKVTLRDKDAKGPIYSAYPKTFEEIEKMIRKENKEK